MRLKRALMLGTSVAMLAIGLWSPAQTNAQERLGCDETDVTLVKTDKFSACYRFDGEAKDLFLWYITNNPTQCFITWNYDGESLEAPADQTRSVSENSNCTVPSKLKVVEWSQAREGRKINRVWLSIKEPSENIDLSIYLGLVPRYARAITTVELLSEPNGRKIGDLWQYLEVQVSVPIRSAEGVWWLVATNSGMRGWLQDVQLEFATAGNERMRKYTNGVETCFYSPVEYLREGQPTYVVYRDGFRYRLGFNFSAGLLENVDYYLWYEGKYFEETLAEGSSVFLPNWWTGAGVLEAAPRIGEEPDWKDHWRWQLEAPCLQEN